MTNKLPLRNRAGRIVGPGAADRDVFARLLGYRGDMDAEWKAYRPDARAIVEAMQPQMNVELSQGTHFFHNLSSFRVPYFSVPLSSRTPVDWDWLAARGLIDAAERPTFERR